MNRTFGWQLQGPADEVSDDVGVAHDDLNRVVLLVHLGAVDVLPEGGLNPGPVLVKSLKEDNASSGSQVGKIF